MKLKDKPITDFREGDGIDEATLPEPTQHVDSRHRRYAPVESDASVAEGRDCFVCSPCSPNIREG